MKGWRASLALRITCVPELSVAGEAEDGQQAVAMCRALQPDLVLMDLNMPLLDGVSALTLIARRWPAILIIALTSTVSEHNAALAIQSSRSNIASLWPIFSAKCRLGYTRHGTVTLFAALDYLQGKLISSIERQHRHQEWLAFLKKINKETPKHLQLHLIVDNYATAALPRCAS